ncbi:hypothetical protein [Microbulbifer sp. PSTR4-B]|uniref:hypothetical protein n=1 Tax=Microbulbifer sp. PSTR4-B TaxID=3243396 RepID=UPI0040398E88
MSRWKSMTLAAIAQALTFGSGEWSPVGQNLQANYRHSSKPNTMSQQARRKRAKWS